MKTLYQKSKTCLLIIVTLISIFFACKKNESIQSQSRPGTGNGSVSGTITDVSNVPVSNATVTGGTATTTTDANGKFTLTKVQFTADTVLVNVTKSGFFESSKNFASANSTVSNATIQLIPKTVSGTVASSSGGNVAIQGGGSVNFNSGFINVSNGNAYTGNVSVSTTYLNPTDQNFSTNVPGDLKNVSNANPKGVLQSFGVIAVEMNDAAGNKLQLATGKTATITLPIPSALQSNAPASIPLWYFDDTKGSWVQEGTAMKQGGNYVGVVKHFSFWTPADLSGSVNVTATFIDSNGLTFPNMLVTITRPDSSMASSYTDTAGTVSGLIPVNEVLIMKVYDTCREVYQTTFGPLSEDTAFGKITIVSYCHQKQPDTTQYINLTLNGNNYSWTPPRNLTQSHDSVTTLLGGSTNDISDSSTYIAFGIESFNTSPGSYPFTIYTIINGNVFYNTYYPNNNPNTVVTEYDAVGGYVTGTATGWIKNFPPPAVDSFQFSCSYRVKRIQ